MVLLFFSVDMVVISMLLSSLSSLSSSFLVFMLFAALIRKSWMKAGMMAKNPKKNGETRTKMKMNSVYINDIGYTLPWTNDSMIVLRAVRTAEMCPKHDVRRENEECCVCVGGDPPAAQGGGPHDQEESEVEHFRSEPDEVKVAEALAILRVLSASAEIGGHSATAAWNVCACGAGRTARSTCGAEGGVRGGGIAAHGHNPRHAEHVNAA